MEIPLGTIAASAVLSSIDIAKATARPPSIEKELLVEAFEYTDTGHDGIYQAEISTPVVEGEYQVLTVINYQDTKKGSKELRMITVVDPEGYVYKVQGGEQTRIANVTVAILALSLDGSESLWNAEKFHQDNPQITDSTGKYSFLVPPGKYRITATAQGYSPYVGEVFEVKEGHGVHFNIEMKENARWYEIFADWKTGIIVLFGIAIVINFINDRRLRKKLSIT